MNLRFTVSVPELLADVPGLTRAITLVNASDFYDERYPSGVLVPGDRDRPLHHHRRGLAAGALTRA